MVLEPSSIVRPAPWGSLCHRRIAGRLVASVGLLLVCAAPASAAPGGRRLTLDLTGANEVNAQGVPNQGDPDGSGTAELRINPGQGRVCWTIHVEGVDPITAAHIHAAPATAPGPVVVPLTPYSGGCTDVTRERPRRSSRTPPLTT